MMPRDEIEMIVHQLWCDIFHLSQISIDTNIFTIGGHSLLLIQLYHQYKTMFCLENKILAISDLFRNPTIIDHAQLIHQSSGIEQQHFQNSWSSLHLIKGK